MKNKICIALSFLLLFIMAGCGNNGTRNGAESTLPQTDGQTEQSADYEQGGSGTEIQESSEAVSEPEQESDMETKTLAAYFSATGTTKPLAEYAAEILNADLYEIVPENPYTERALKKSDSKKKELGFFRVGIIIEIWEGGLRNAERSFTVETTIITLSGDLRCDYSRQSSSAENEREYRF